MTYSNLLRRAACMLFLGLALNALADVTIEVTGTNTKPLAIAIANFAGEASLKEQLTPVIRADLERSGRFKLIEAGAAAPSPDAPADLASWKARGADSLATGSVRIEADGSATVRLRVADAVTQKSLAYWEMRSRPAESRRAAHQLADAIYETLTGDRGVFSTRIAYVLKQAKRYELQVADADGANAQMVFGSPEPIMSPTWSSDGSKLAYVSFERKKAVVFVQDLFAGTRRAAAAFKGSNSAPAFTPDGNSLIVTLTLDGISQLYKVPVAGGEPQRLSRSSSIDTEARVSPDGQTIAFTSDRGGSPQLYLMSANGGDAQRLSFDGNYNVTPRFSPDGKTITYIRRDGGRFGVASLDIASRQVQTLTDGPVDESPTFAPNGKLILYASEVGGRGVLATVSSDGRVRQRLSTNGDAREPAWGPIPSLLPMNRLSTNP
ncbi:Tol-Pal system beta propeller repeat protein TolB [Chitinimonas sp.]|uniref:Tol-Pal system beta propeller repeat protein TolB n=1 Tax=Chitinimonas sp. TaxID=1934313 RepID=UPI0035B078F2